MHVINAVNVNDALGKGLHYLQLHGVNRPSRNGSVLVAPGPVTTSYNRPIERVLFCPIRDANPFFHLMEALWMMAGRNDVAFPAQFNSRISSFSDDGEKFNAAYGHRWRSHFSHDQIRWAIKELRFDPNSRRVVIAMWDPGYRRTEFHPGAGVDDVAGDHLAIDSSSKDVPCNTHIYLWVNNGQLDMTVCNRSNDIVWGAYGANAVHMSVLQEIIATALGREIGFYYQMSNNYHLYTDVVNNDQLAVRAISAMENNLYTRSTLVSDVVPLMSEDLDTWFKDLDLFLQCDPVRTAPRFEDDFFKTVAFPMYRAWALRKRGDGGVLETLDRIKSTDWRLACMAWVARRQK
jgi:thymidylate synthase